MEGLETITKCSKILDKLVSEYPNTKKKIKDMTSQLRRNIEVIGRVTVQEWLEKHKWERIEKQTFDVDIQTDVAVDSDISVKDLLQKTSIERVEVGIQTEERTIRKDVVDMRKQIEGLDPPWNLDKVTKILDKRWSEEVFSKVKMVGDRQLSRFKEADHVWLYRDAEELESVPMGEARENFQEYELNDGVSDSPTGMPVSKMIQSGLINVEGDMINRSTKYLHVVRLITVQNKDDTLSMLNSLSKIRDINSKKETRKLIILAPADPDGSLRKALKIVFAKETYKTGLWLRDRSRERMKNIGDFRSSRQKKNDVYTLRPTEGTTYAELVRNMRDKVDVIGVTVNQMEKTTNGLIRIKVTGKDDTARQNFKNSLEKNLKETAEIRTRTPKKALRILDLDITITKEDIRSVLNEVLNGELGDMGTIKVNEKENKSGNKHAFLILPAGLALK